MASQQQGDSVNVAVNVRPLITQELLLGCTDCVTFMPGEPQVRTIPFLRGPYCWSFANHHSTRAS
jgi:kinesin family protein 4/21/27